MQNCNERLKKKDKDDEKLTKVKHKMLLLCSCGGIKHEFSIPKIGGSGVQQFTLVNFNLMAAFSCRVTVLCKHETNRSLPTCSYRT